MTTSVAKVKVSKSYDSLAWTWMRYSGLLLIPLAWIHVLIQDVIVGVHKISLDYVALRWATMGWRVYDFLLLSFAFAHGMNGLRQVLIDFLKTDQQRRLVSWALLILWMIISLIGAGAIIGNVRLPAPQ